MRDREDRFDVVVAGGGISGTEAAVAAASEGCRSNYVIGGKGRAILEGMSTRSPTR